MSVNLLYTENALPGMVLADDIYDSKGLMIMKKGTRLDYELLKRIWSHHVMLLPIDSDSIKEGREHDDRDISYSSKEKNGEITEGYYRRLSKTEEFSRFSDTFQDSVDGLKNNLNDIVNKNAKIDVTNMLKGVKDVIAANDNGLNMIDMLNCMRGFDDLTYVHSMNVALISNVMGGWLRMKGDELDLLTAAGLLHDIGKLQIPPEIIMKPGKLTDEEYETIKHHPVLGYKIMEKADIDFSIKCAALQHHERYDGSGYPFGVRSDKINKYARIVAIADVYDAMTANRVYRTGLCPFRVLEHCEKNLDVYDPKYILLFLESAANTYIKSEVELSNGERGVIIMINSTSYSRPLVMVGTKIVDLNQNKDITIERLL